MPKVDLRARIQELERIAEQRRVRIEELEEELATKGHRDLLDKHRRIRQDDPLI